MDRSMAGSSSFITYLDCRMDTGRNKFSPSSFITDLDCRMDTGRNMSSPSTCSTDLDSRLDTDKNMSSPSSFITDLDCRLDKHRSRSAPSSSSIYLECKLDTDSSLAAAGRIHETVAYKFVRDLHSLMKENRQISDYPEVGHPSLESGFTSSIARLILEIILDYLFESTYHNEISSILCRLKVLSKHDITERVQFMNRLLHNTAQKFLSSTDLYNCFELLSFISELLYGLFETPEMYLIPYVIEKSTRILIEKFNWKSGNDVADLDNYAKWWLKQYMPNFSYIPLRSKLRVNLYYFNCYFNART